ncbi:permease [Pleurocapsa sp. FMAR1]|uniref:permease n=1 Tax=Pleurocapsa sp. FMAR1 TaxID=3040204 RepID=UPI0029C94928|nr:permease [Pleurocapsa sp. FMAR1]
MNQLHNAFTLFLSLLVEAMPFLLLGVLLSSFLLFLINEKQLIARLPKNPFLGAVVGSCIGFLFPVCECGNVPVARRLLLTGVSPSVAISFLLAAPTINPIVIWSTWVAFGDRPSIVFFRVLFSLAIATIIGCIFSVQKDVRFLLQESFSKRLKPVNYYQLEEAESISPLLQSGSFLIEQGQSLALDSSFSSAVVKKQASSLQLFIDNVLQEFSELGAMLVFGSAIAAAIQVFVPRELILSLGQDTVTSILAMMLLAAIVSICSTVDSFFALSFASTFTGGSLLAFLVFGPTIDIKSIGLMASIFKPKIIIYIFTLIAQLTFIFTLAYSYFF